MRVVNLKIDGALTKFKMPTCWDEVSIGQYSDLMKAIDKEGSSEIELMIKSLEALVGIDGGVLSKAPLKQIKAAYSELSDLTKVMPTNELSRVVEIDGVEYGIIPDFDDLSLGEFVDLDNYLQDSWNNLDKIFAVLYRKVTNRKDVSYTIEDYSMDNIKDRRKLFKDRLSIDTVYGALVFFYTIGSEYIENTLSYLEEENRSLKKTNPGSKRIKQKEKA